MTPLDKLNCRRILNLVLNESEKGNKKNLTYNTEVGEVCLFLFENNEVIFNTNVYISDKMYYPETRFTQRVDILINQYKDFIEKSIK